MTFDYMYQAEVLRVLDGKTVELLVDLGFGLSHTAIFPLTYVEIGDINSEDQEEKEKATQAKEYLKTSLEKRIVIKTSKLNKNDDLYKYSVEIVNLETGININLALRLSGLAKNRFF